MALVGKVERKWLQIGIKSVTIKKVSSWQTGQRMVRAPFPADSKRGSQPEGGRACLMTAPKTRGLGREEMEGDIPQWKPRKRAD